MKSSAFFTLILISALLLFSGCGGKSLVIDRWSPEPIVKASPGIMALLEEAGARRDWPNAHTVSVFETDSTFFYPDGNQVSAMYSLSKIITMKGAKDYSTIPIGYDTQQMTVDIIYVRVIYPDSTVVSVSDSDITDETLEGFAEMDIYWSNLRQKVIHMPELEVGCGIELAVVMETVQPMLEGMMDYRAGFQSTEPVLHSEAILVLPVSEEMTWRVYNDPENKVSFNEEIIDDSLRIYRWTGNGFQMAITEEGMPPIGDFLTKVLASNTTWEEYSRKVYELSAPNMVADDAIREKVAELTKDAESDMDSIRAIAYYASQDVRYIGLSLGAKEGITPHDVRETFKAQCGVCKDKSALLAVMLQEAGFEAYIALSNPLNHVYKEVAANQFNHMIVVVYDRSGSEHWIDPTDPVCMDMLPAYHMNKAVLVCNETGSDLRYLPVLPPETQEGNISADSRILDDGTYKSEVSITGKGIYDEILRLIFQQMEPTQQRRFWTDMIKKQVHPSARITDLSVKPDPIKNLWEPVEVKITYEIPDYAIVAGDYLLVKSPIATGAFDIMGLVLSQTTALTERDFPLNIQFTVGSVLTEKTTLPGGYDAKSLPETVNISNPAASFTMDYRLEDNIVTYKSSFMIKKPSIPADEYPGYRSAAKKSGSAGQGMIILTKEGGA
ncbi:hypothetical protein DRQ36_07740 [bacterium]|nr:MAG: hypothetical protein DRQ36_07740 [bacterium]